MFYSWYGMLYLPNLQRVGSLVGSRIATATDTYNLATTALVSRLGNGGVEHGPHGLNVPHLPQNVFEALPEVELKLRLTGDSARRSQQTLKIRLGLPGLIGILSPHRSQLTTR
ncbi:hypothetical protein ATANTOWER_005393 [Ataeniobius toweri]|uniref:Uncharacterized protein n=1 Tax=Ataeniobius toweri TaxID=208326 RepID=A0ABU7B4U7_9TELE|nr:hypothetical protein [Ataeniobius toweri]